MSKYTLKRKKYNAANREKINLYSVQLYNKHRTRILQNAKTDPRIKASKRKHYKKYRKTIIAKVVHYNKKYYVERRKRDISFKLLTYLRTYLNKALKKKKIKKQVSIKKLLGCSVPELKLHIESQFEPGMSWDNYGEWEIDHIIPCAGFDLATIEEQRRCFNYNNLQPLWWEDNLAKSNKVHYKG